MATPFGRGAVERALLKSADLSVYDFDDALMWEPDGNAMRRAVTSRSEQCRNAVEQADVVIAGSDRLAEWAAKYGRDVRVIPTCVDPDEYPLKASYDIAGPPVIGWLGSPSTERYLRAVTQPLLELNRRNGARLLVVSSGAADLGALEQMTDRVEWTLSGYGSAIATADVAIAPLLDTPYAWGKCAYKMLQYAAIGLPTVASPIGANMVAAARLGAHTATDSSEWIDGLTDLLTISPQSRSLRGTEARQAVTDHYSYARWRDAWLDAQGLRY
jgi:glycosyltransferase involved in cell wall biosynthesis